MQVPRRLGKPLVQSLSLVWVPLAIAAACMASCGGGGLSPADAGTNANPDGSLPSGGGVCGSAPSGTCANSSQVFCGNGNCCDSAHPFYCSSNGLCYGTAALASAVCGASCGACSPSGGGGTEGGTGGRDAGPIGGGGSCAPPAQPGICNAGDLSCGSGSCCHGQFPFYCSSTSTCYAKQSEAGAACGDSCTGCVAPSSGGADGGTGGGSCAPAQPGNCNTGDLSCGPGSCCHAQFPFFCASSNLCYATQSDAAGTCGTSCASCVTPSGGGGGTDGGSGGGGSCPRAPSGASCNTGDLVCGTGSCCHSQFPFYCPSTNLCYGKQAEASAACPGSCVACHP